MKPVSEKLLSPKLLTETDPSYESVKELDAAVEQQACKNIAVTGINGAGKSSVINTFCSKYEIKYPNKRLLRISLSTYDLNEKEKTKKGYENDIEYKLVQQILYRSDPDELYQSSFRRIHYRPGEVIKRIAKYLIISLAAFIILFEPAFLRVGSVYDLYYQLLGDSLGIWVDRISDLLCLGWFVYVGYLAAIWATKRISAISSLRVKAKDFEVEFAKNSSVFSKLLEEINYFFVAGEYDVVVIEDLDRLKNPSGLFLKLRELNIMLNESFVFRSRGRVIKFIYAVRDDLFASDIRVKFFDYIVPVVPIINSYNAADYILEKRRDIYEGKDVLKQDIPEIVLYVKEMRVLQNILNEFETYQRIIFQQQDNLSDSKLLAMIVYKNLWPDNYSKLHSRDSVLNKLFDNPESFVKRLEKGVIERQSALQEEKATLENEARSIRKDFVDYLGSKYKVKALRVNNMPYSLTDLIDYDYLFIWLQQDKYEKFDYEDPQNRESESFERNFTFEELAEHVDPDGSMIKRLLKLREYLDRNEMEKSRIDAEIEHKMASSYKEILANVDGDDAIECIIEHLGVGVPKELSGFILSMLRKGHIAEDYFKYISFYYEGSVSARDSAFINAVLQGRNLGFDYQLDNPEVVRRQLQKEDNYNGNSILNYSFVAFLMRSNDAIIRKVTESARNNWGFIRGCDQVGGSMLGYLRNHVFDWWYDCLESIFKGEKEDFSDNLKVFFHYCPNDVNVNDDTKEALSSLYDIVAGGVSLETAPQVASWLKSNNIFFKTIRLPIAEHEIPLFDAVLKDGLFEITQDNLSMIMGKEYDDASYTVINDYKNESLKAYLKSNITKVIATFPESSINEDEKCLKELLVDNRIDEAWKKAYLEKQLIIIHDLEGLSEEAIKIIVLSGKMLATWENVYVAANNNAQEGLKVYVAANIQELSAQKCALAEVQALSVEKMLFSDNDYLTLEHYELLASSFSAPMAPEDLEGVNNERMSIIVRNTLLVFSESGLKLISSYETPVIAGYVVSHFEEYKDLYEDYNDFCNNEFGAIVLDSTLTIEQKKFYLNSIAPSALDVDGYYHAYSKRICVFVNSIGITPDTDLSLVINALEGYDEEGGWYVKISLVNKINAATDYDELREIKMINALGGGYPRLNSYNGYTEYDNNPQNQELLGFLMKHGHHVNRFYPQRDGLLRVTFKRAPTEKSGVV